MKKSDISYQEKLNELRLDISHPNSKGLSFILLEGETDIRLFRKLFNLNNCKVENIPGGNIKLEECVQNLVNIYPLIIGIRDADFIRINKSEYLLNNMFLTDLHDIEITILNFEPILNAIVFEYSNIKKDNHLIIKNEFIETIKHISFLKLLNDKDNLELNFSSGFQDLISFSNKKIDFEQYLNRVIAKSPNAVIKDKDKLKEMIILIENSEPDLLQITNGHDLLNSFAKYFREEEKRNGVKGENLEATLRMLFNIDFFKHTNLYQKLNDWQNQNNVEIFA
ncbi:hypothetical protein [uncultured Algoriphagus sp.]|uniref:hypothetical protein n=1 Tax=uncultured Algoriphagus sp. TaxID=417365 RepID=UPI0030EE5A16|tara:strand:+ start:50054 stop:50896 length:843 start_codon:yes stop_codon:yes gene_type:complete